MAAEDWFDWENNPFREEIPVARPLRTYVPGTWVTAKGDAIKFADMEHTHLLNTIAFVERRYREMQDTFCDAALDIDLLWPSYAGLVAEARRRKLIPPGKKHEMVTT